MIETHFDFKTEDCLCMKNKFALFLCNFSYLEVRKVFIEKERGAHGNTWKPKEYHRGFTKI